MRLQVAANALLKGLHAFGIPNLLHLTGPILVRRVEWGDFSVCVLRVHYLVIAVTRPYQG